MLKNTCMINRKQERKDEQHKIHSTLPCWFERKYKVSLQQRLHFHVSDKHKYIQPHRQYTYIDTYMHIFIDETSWVWQDRSWKPEARDRLYSPSDSLVQHERSIRGQLAEVQEYPRALRPVSNLGNGQFLVHSRKLAVHKTGKIVNMTDMIWHDYGIICNSATL